MRVARSQLLQSFFFAFHSFLAFAQFLAQSVQFSLHLVSLVSVRSLHVCELLLQVFQLRFVPLDCRLLLRNDVTHLQIERIDFRLPQQLTTDIEEV